jgi:hypothetical protein
MAEATLRSIGVATMAAIALVVPMAGSAAATEDALTAYGPSTVHVPFSRAYVFAVSCAVLPCEIKLTEHATANGRHIAGLDHTSGPPITMTQQPSAGPEPICSEEEEDESLIEGTCARKEAWEEKKEAHEIYAVWFVRSDFNGRLLNGTLKRDRTVVLHVTATLTDAVGKQIAASRPITLRPGRTAAQRHHQEQREAEKQKHWEESPRGKIEHAEEEYCEKVLRGIADTPFIVAGGHIYLKCSADAGTVDHHEVIVNESDIRG